jgi:hypothetical protein
MMMHCKICSKYFDTWESKAAHGFCSDWCERSPFLPFPELKAIVLLLIALVALTGAARAQSILNSVDSYNVDGGGLVSTLANGEQWLILHNHDGLGIQLQPGMPSAATFETDIVINAGDKSVRISVAGDCWEKTYEFMGDQVYQHTYRTGLPLGAPQGPDGVIRHFEPGKDIEIYWLFAAVCTTGTPGAALGARSGGSK